MALGHIGPWAVTMPTKYQKYIQKYTPISCMFLYTFEYIWPYIAFFLAS